MTKLQSNQEWIFWGKHNPMFAVATLPGKQVGGKAPWTVEELLEMGRMYFADVYQQWRQYGVGSEHCVEIGCGSGRITRQLCSNFHRVSGIDVSPEQLQTARQLLGESVENATLILVAEPALPFPDFSCDAVFSCEVFQHFDDDRPLRAYLQEAYRILISGGTICFQLPVRGLHSATLLSSTARNVLLRILRQLGRRRMMVYRQYKAESVFEMLMQTGFEDIEMRVFHASQQQGFHAYFLSRKP